MFDIRKWQFMSNLVQILVSSCIYKDNTDYFTLMVYNFKRFWQSFDSALRVIST